MAAQDFYIHTKYIQTRENLAFWLSMPFIGLFMVLLFGQYNHAVALFSLAVVLAVSVSALNAFLLGNLPKWYKFKNIYQRAITQAVTIAVFSIVAALVSGNIASSLVDISFTEGIKFSFATAIITLSANAVFSAVYYLRQWQKNVLFAEELKREIMHTQLEGIRQQLSPHFFFNSLNSLSLVIQEDPAEAVKYVQHIAHMYRYLLQSKDTKVVPLQHELRFAESYIYLQKMRFGKALDMTIAIEKAETQTVIPPLTLYILLENALKHNIITKAKPLHIQVIIRDGKLQISNNIQARHLPEENPVIGLKTVRSSYESISMQPMQVIQDDANFTVALPLIKELSQTA